MRRKKLLTSETTQMITCITNEACDITRYPGKQFFKRVAVELVGRYPETFGEMHADDGSFIGEGHYLIMRKLEEKFGNMNTSFRLFAKVYFL